MSKFKVGDKARVVGYSKPYHFFSLGDEGFVIHENFQGGGSVLFRHDSKESSIKPEDLKLIR